MSAKAKSGRQERRKNVLILLWSSTISSGRDFLAGFARRARHRRDWNLHLRISKKTLEPNILHTIKLGGYNGIVTDEDSYNSMPKDAIPTQTSVVVFGTYDPNAPKNVFFVQNDNAAIGRFGGQYLFGLGRFRSFGFVPTEVKHGWSQIRAEAFAKELGRRKIAVHVFDHSDKSSSLKAYLVGLQKPAAVMAACDTTALEVIETCKRAKLAIPGQISILGVDNDELLCEFDNPTISSVLPRHDTVGEMAVTALAKMFRNPRTCKPRVTICDKQTVVERESTAPLSPATHLITSALDFIRQNATKAITTDDVVRHLGVSRSLAALRFREYQGETAGRGQEATGHDAAFRHQGRPRLRFHRYPTPPGGLQKALRSSNGQVASRVLLARPRLSVLGTAKPDWLGTRSRSAWLATKREPRLRGGYQGSPAAALTAALPAAWRSPSRRGWCRK